MLLRLKGLGVQNLFDFEFFDKRPSRDGLVQSLDLLFHLGVIDDSGELTDPRGLLQVELPIDVRFGAAILAANEQKYMVFNEMLTIASLMQFSSQLFSNQVDSISVSKIKKRAHHGATEGDHITLLNIYNKLFAADKNQAQRNGICRELRLNQWAWDKAHEVRQSLRKQLLTKLGVVVRKSDDYDDPQAILKVLATSFFTNVAQR